MTHTILTGEPTGFKGAPKIREMGGLRPAPTLAIALLALALASCAPARTTARPAAPAPAANPEVLMEQLRARWQARATHEVIALFAPSRRALARRHANLIEARLEAWSVEGWHLDPRCHGRGPDLLIARLELRPRQHFTREADGAPRHLEALWLIHQQGGWWLYSL